VGGGALVAVPPLDEAEVRARLVAPVAFVAVVGRLLDPAAMVT
jgi:hypothetical protein